MHCLWKPVQVDLTRCIVLVLRVDDDRNADTRIERHDRFGIPCAQGGGEAGEVRLVLEAIHLVGEVAAVDPPAGDVFLPADRPFANHGLPVPLEFNEAAADRLTR